MSELIFISGVQKELAAERRCVADYIRSDPLLRRFFDVFVFEELPASDRRPDDAYLDQVDRCAIYLGIFGDDFGTEDAAGSSSTQREFDYATSRGKERLVFVRGSHDKGRHPKMQALIQTSGRQLIRRRFASIPDLTAAVYASLVDYMEQTGLIATKPFDATVCSDATLADIDEEKLKWFLERAHNLRGYPLDEKTPLKKALAHMNLIDRGRPSRAAILLFAKKPQRFLITSEVKCAHFHGTSVRKPIPSYHIYKGTVFEMIDQALDFVMSKIALSVGTPEQGAAVSVDYELPADAVREAIVNAVAHRDYANNASVQVMLFADRLEVWNPGHLPPELSIEQLREPHRSIPRNPLVCEPMYLAGHAEKAGSGILDMIALCKKAGLPEPEFRQDGGQFVQALWRDWLTSEVLAGLDLNERQMGAIDAAKRERRLTTLRYQELTGASRATAKRDLADLVHKGLLLAIGSGRATHYEVPRKRVTNGSIGS